jgi:hypothetical protein
MQAPYEITWNGKHYAKGETIDNPQLIAALGGDQSGEKPAAKPKAKD